VGLDRNAIAGTAGLSGPYRFMPPTKDFGVFSMPLSATTADPDIEPINFVDGREPAMLLLTGLDDKTVRPDNSAALAKRIEERGGVVQYISYEKVGHVQMVLSLAAPFRWISPALEDVTAFFHKHQQRGQPGVVR